MDSPNLVSRGAALVQGTRSVKGGESAQRGGASGGIAAAGAASSGSVLALLDSLSRQRHLGSGQSYKQQGEAGNESSPATSSAGTAAGPEVDPAAREVTQAFQQNFARAASDHDRFHELMRQAFGQNYDYAAAENIRNQTLAGDFSWMPDVRVVDAETLVDQSGTQASGTALGAYSAETDTIYISSEVLENDPHRALEIMTEEVGHGLDARLNETDSAGDEGDIFARLLAGDDLSQEELDALRAENDSGTIVIDGQEIEVEYGSDPFKAIGDVFTAPFRALSASFDAITSLVSDAWDAIKDAVIKVLNSPIFNALLLIASFIPVLNVVVLVIQIVKAVYMIYQGIKHGSIAMVLGGIASLATGVGNLGAAMGASAKFVATAGKVADWANAAAKTYQAASQEDFAAAFSILSETFTGTDAGTAFGHASNAYSAYETVDSGDMLGAMSIGSGLLGDLTTGDTAEFFDSVDGHTETFGNIVEAVRTGDYRAAADNLIANYGDNIGLDTDQQARVVQIAGALETADGARHMIKDGNYAGAAMALYVSAEQFGIGDKAGAVLFDAAETVARVADLAMLIGRGEYGEAVALGAAIMDADPSPEMQQQVDRLVGQAERVERVIDAIDTGDYTAALGMIADGFGAPMDPKTKQTLGDLQTRIEAATALEEAVDNGDVGDALAAVEALTGTELPKVAERVEGLENVAERVADIKEAVETGQYARAAERASTIADGLGDKQLARSLRGLATLLERLGFPPAASDARTAA